MNGDDIMRAGNPCACTSLRREFIKSAIGVAVVALAPCQAPAQTVDPQNARPQTGDRLVYSSGPKKGAVVAPGDVPLGGPHVSTYAQHPATGVIRDGSRLNEVILVRFDPNDLTDAARTSAPQGYVALSAICTHAGCSDWAWDAGRKVLKCPCHDSEFDPKDDARVSGGPATRRLPRLPLKVEGDTLVVAGAFVGRVGIDIT